ncbi:MAG: glutamate cyclase domain-containing protein [Clostridia bacterium]
MENIYLKIDEIIKQDPGKRNLIDDNTKNPLEMIVKSLLGASHVVITTGFFIPEANSIETDGPVGALLLADTLSQLEIKTTILIENYAKSIFLFANNCLENSINYKFINKDKKYSFSELIEDDVTHFIALERPGMASDGNYYNHKGNTINKYHNELDEHFLKAREQGITTIGIGDGGNELGLGSDYHFFKKKVVNGEKTCTIISAQFSVLAGVSNWAGYAIASLLKYEFGSKTFYDESILHCILDEAVKNGAVDGIRKKPVRTVDGLTEDWEGKILKEINIILKESISI